MITSLKFAGLALAGAALAFWLGVTTGKGIGRAEIEAAAARQAVERITELDKNNANFKNLPDHARCVAFMRFSGLPVSECD